ncbi:type VII toxin-antitoxin system MntA family adenylyltransferase antitoxin [Halonatronum saccharophilum]|uniref:type VII toxin-antitoxin system MntA family adenylyltransferase antitoxin n=1 Tax=Halonatronum saccharophilum TaxID=150060 RepID=UPI00048299CC|nr:nucleotidyltransferase domain-containing protein [Halonatronum saccharophilum]
MINIEDNIKALTDYFKGEEEIVAAYLFGSYGTEYQTELSDIDFAILFEKDEEVNLMREMEIMAQISMILKVENVDLVNLNKGPIYLQHEIIKTGRLIFERDEDKVTNFIYHILTYYYDEKIRLDKYYKEYKRALKEEYQND